MHNALSCPEFSWFQSLNPLPPPHNAYTHCEQRPETPEYRHTVLLFKHLQPCADDHGGHEHADSARRSLQLLPQRRPALAARCFPEPYDRRPYGHHHQTNEQDEEPSDPADEERILRNGIESVERHQPGRRRKPRGERPPYRLFRRLSEPRASRILPMHRTIRTPRIAPPVVVGRAAIPIPIVTVRLDAARPLPQHRPPPNGPSVSMPSSLSTLHKERE